ncbi:uncharacterized protein LOC141608350 [Silene latifolia]|uniref:uncharacterized protein LOC141608350 n=1 Tax=Silene latifolia TaxID=37657 RepID=UPI003D77B319
MGMVIRDFEGKVERAGVVQVYEKWTPEIAEAKAAEFGLRTARQMGLQNVELESDSMTLINMLRARTFPLNYFGRIGRTVLDIANSFTCIKFNFTRRNGNAVAHGLAHLLPLSILQRNFNKIISNLNSATLKTDAGSVITLEEMDEVQEALAIYCKENIYEVND